MKTFYLVSWETGSTIYSVDAFDRLDNVIWKAQNAMSVDSFFEYDIFAKEDDKIWIIEETIDGKEWTLYKDKDGVYVSWESELKKIQLIEMRDRALTESR